MVLAWLMWGQIWHLPEPANWVGESLKRGAVAPSSAFVLGESTPTPVPLALAMKLVNSVTPHMSLVLFELSPPHWSPEWVCEWIRVQAPQEEHLRFLHSLDAIFIGFHNQMLWGLLYLALVAWSGDPGVGLDPLLLRETSTAEISLSILNRHTMGLGTAHLMCLLFLPVLSWDFLYIFSYRASI